MRREARAQARGTGTGAGTRHGYEALSMIYEVFARKNRGEPLHHIGNLNAPDVELAKVYAFNTYDEERWFDMYVVEREALTEVFTVDRGEPVEAE